MQKYNLKLKNEDIRRRGIYFALDVIKFIDNLNKNDYTVSVMSKQLIRSATSIGANITEAQACNTRKDFTHFLTHALKSANETKFWLEILKDSKKSDENQTQIILNEAIEISNILGASIIKLKNKH